MNDKLNTYNKVLEYIDFSFQNKKIINEVSSSNHWQKISIQLISIINYYEVNKIVESENTPRLILAYKTITKTTSDPELIIYKNDSEFEDIVGYFSVLVQNTFKQSIEDLQLEQIKSYNDKDVIDTEVVGNKSDDNTTNNSTNNEHNNNSSFDADEFMHKNGYTMNDVADQMINQMANNILRQKIFTGEVYIYQTKPKFIFALKIISVIIILALMCLSIAQISLMSVASGNLQTYILDNNKTPIAVNIDNVNWTSILSLILNLLVMGIIIWGFIKNNKNENFKYKFNWGLPVFYLGIQIIMLISLAAQPGTSCIFNYNGFVNYFLKGIDNTNFPTDGSQTQLIKDNMKYVGYLNAYRIVWIVSYSLLGVFLIIVILGVIFNPKKDILRMQKLLEDIAYKIKSGEIDPSSMGNVGFGGFSSFF